MFSMRLNQCFSLNKRSIGMELGLGTLPGCQPLSQTSHGCYGTAFRHISVSKRYFSVSKFSWVHSGRSGGGRHVRQRSHGVRALRDKRLSDTTSSRNTSECLPQQAASQDQTCTAVEATNEVYQSVQSGEWLQAEQPRWQPQRLASNSMAALAAVWDQLAPRLPLQLGVGQGSEVILNALKLAFASSSATWSLGALAWHHNRQQAFQATPPVQLALRLADLASGGIPLDADSIAAGIVAETLCVGDAIDGSSYRSQTLLLIEQRVSPAVAQLVHDIHKVRALPSRVDIYDDNAASALRELCLAFYDARATAVEVTSRLEGIAAALAPGSGVPRYQRQVAALEALQIYAPLGHALGMGRLAAELEDCCFQVLFPQSYSRTATWLLHESAAGQDALERCQEAIRKAVLGEPRFHLLAGGVHVQGRTKSLFSTLKKLLRLGETARGGRSRAEIYDLMGIRVVVQPRGDLPPGEAQEAAAQACYLVREVVQSLWEVVPGRCKDYIAAPKPNGYQSLHTSVRVWQGGLAGSTRDVEGWEVEPQQRLEAGASPPLSCTLELQIRTQEMHERAEMGQAAHAAYKGGLAASQVRQLREWTQARRLLAAGTAHAALGPATAAGTAAPASAGTGAAEGESAGAALFRHLDRNGDGRLNLEELRQAVRELGVEEAGGQAAAEEVMALLDADADGSIDLGEFLEFQRKAGLMRAISQVDTHTAEQLPADPQQAQRGADGPRGVPHPAGGSGNGADTIASAGSTAGTAQNWRPGGGSPPSVGGLRLRSAAPWAAARRGIFHWVARNSGSFSAMHVNSRSSFDGSSGSSSSGGGGGSFSSTDVLDSLPTEVELAEEGPRIISISTTKRVNCHKNGPRGGRGGAGVTAEQSRRHGSSRGVEPQQAQQAAPGDSSNSSRRQHRSVAPAASSTVAQPPPAPAGSDDLAVVAPKPSRNHPNSDRSASGAASGAAATESSSSEGADPGGESAAGGDPREGSGSRGSPPPARVSRALSAAMRPILRVWQKNRPLPATADWCLVPAPNNPHPLRGSAGQQLGEVQLPQLGPCVVGAVRTRDCDVVLDVPTVSGRHARLLVQRRADKDASQLVVTDVGSTNGTWVNRYRIKAFRDVPLYPGDLVHFADPDVGFIVKVAPQPREAPAPPAVAAQAAVAAALAAAAELETAAAAGGVFPSPADGAMSHSAADVAQRARKLMVAGEYVPARMLLLGEVMRQPGDGGLWAQLANLERNLAVHSSSAATAAGPPSCGTARAFYGAAVSCYQAAPPQDPPARQGLVRSLSSWAQMEYSQGNDRAARDLFRLAVHHARRDLAPDAPHQHSTSPSSSAAAADVDLPRLLFTFAHKEWKKGDKALATSLAKQALELQPANHFALALLANISGEAGQVEAARQLFQQALDSQPKYVTALQCWARMEAQAGDLPRARQLFERALDLEPGNTFVLQAWAVAEGREGHHDAARRLLARCLERDPECRKAWHAWAKLEEEQGDRAKARELYQKVLGMSRNSVETLSALGRLERLEGRTEEAEALLQRAVRLDPRSASALAELAAVREAQGDEKEAVKLRARAQQVNSSRRAQLGLVRRRRGRGAAGGARQGHTSPSPLLEKEQGGKGGDQGQ